MHLSTAHPHPHPVRWLRLLSVLILRFCCYCCWFIVLCTSHCLRGRGRGGSVLVFVFGMRYSVSVLVLKSSWWGRESWMLCFNCLPNVLWLLMFCESSSWCCGLVCSTLLWYFLIILTYFAGDPKYLWFHEHSKNWIHFLTHYKLLSASNVLTRMLVRTSCQCNSQ